jgi:acyl carrier protein
MPSYADSLKITCDLLRPHVEPSREIHPGDRIQEDLGLDSLTVMEFAADIETRFDVSIPPDLYDRIVTVEDVAKVVVSLSSGSPLVREKSPH